MGEHCIGNLHERRHVRTRDEIVRAAVLRGIGLCLLEDIRHDALQAIVNFLERPGQTLGVL